MRLPLVGDIFESKYEIREALGEGGFATVFRATDLEVGRDVAIKVLAPRDGEYAGGVVARFMVEARVIAGLQDAHTIRLFEFGEAQDGLLYMVFQYVSGMDLGTLLHERGALDPGVALHVARQVLHALAEAHEAGVLHRDIKPANVLIHAYMGDDYSVKLLDFGIAKVDASAGGLGLTKTGTLLGTPRYMAPEQVFGEQLGPATDIYSLGLLLYEMLVGQPAVPGSKKDILAHHAAEQRHHIPAHVGWPALRGVVERMVAHEPHRRFQSAQETIAALDDALRVRASEEYAIAAPRPSYSSDSGSSSVAPSGSGAVTPRSSSSDSLVSDRPRSRGSVIAWVAFSLGVLAVGIWGASRGGDGPAEPPPPGEIPAALLETTEAPPQPKASVQLPDEGAVDAGAPVDLGPGVDELRAPPIVAASVRSGCGKPLPEAKKGRATPRVTLTIAGYVRTMRLYTPLDYDRRKQYPAVVTLHHLHEGPGNYLDQIGLKPTRGDQFVVLALESMNEFTTWGKGEGDAEFVKAAAVMGHELLCIDRTRIYGAGHHDGARLLRELACQVQFSAIQTTGYGDSGPGCAPNPPVPWIRILGRSDRVAPPGGGIGCRDRRHMSSEEHDRVWRTLNSCRGPSVVFEENDRGTCQTWDCQTPYVSCLVEGGHDFVDSTWDFFDPPGCSGPLIDFDIGKVTRRFFFEQGRAIE